MGPEWIVPCEAWTSSRDEDNRLRKHAPASVALVSSTVWNHVGKVYTTVKLHDVAMRKLLTLTRTRTCFFRRNSWGTTQK